MRAAASTLLLAVLGACESRPSASPAPAEANTPPIAATAATGRRDELRAPLEYLEIVPDGAASGEPLPTIVAIHGLGDRPQGFAGLFQGMEARARILLPAGPERHLDGFTWFPFRRDREEGELARGIEAAVERVHAFVEWARAHRPTVGRPIVTGFSQGGMISFGMALKYPESIAAALPVGGLIPAPLWPKAAPLARCPVLAFHGEADPVVPFEPTARAVTHLESVGFEVELRSFPGVAHHIPPAMRAALHEALRRRVDALGR